jgi:hypothetical protein
VSLSLVREIRRARERLSETSERSEIPSDPVAFAEFLGFTPDDWQEEILNSSAPRKLMLCGRQTGKTSVAALLAIHKALVMPNSTTLMVAPSERQAKLAFSRASAFYREAGAPVPLRSDRRTGMELANGSVIEALPALERTIRGFSVDLLIIDEAAAVPDQDYFALLPSLIATRGEQLLLSTPRGKRGFFYDLWSSPVSEGDGEHNHVPRWFKKSVRSDEVDRIRPEDLELFKQAMPEEWFRQEFLCEFLDAEGSLFAVDDIEAAIAAGEDLQAIHLEGDEEW